MVERLSGLVSEFQTGDDDVNQLRRAKSAHLAWKGKLRGFLDGKASIDERVAFSHRECGLGKWFADVGHQRFGHLPESKAIEQPHRELHETIRKAVEHKRAGNSAAAEKAYEQVGPLSDKIVGLITDLERHVGH